MRMNPAQPTRIFFLRELAFKALCLKGGKRMGAVITHVATVRRLNLPPRRPSLLLHLALRHPPIFMRTHYRHLLLSCRLDYLSPIYYVGVMPLLLLFGACGRGTDEMEFIILMFIILVHYSLCLSVF